MKKIALFLITIGTFLSLNNCAENLEFNNPAIQAFKENDAWRARYYAADIDFGGFVIEGGVNGETVQLITVTDTRGTFDLGGENPSIAIFKDSQGVVYSTANEPDPSLSVYPAEGQIVVDNITSADPKEIIGSFWFTAYSADGMQSINFNRGVFYKVPIVGGLSQISN